MISAEDRNILEKFLKASNIKWPVEELVNTFKNPRYDKKKLTQLVESLVQHDATMVTEFQRQSEISNNYLALMMILDKLSDDDLRANSVRKNVRFSNETENQFGNCGKSCIESPIISSTKIFSSDSREKSSLVDLDKININRSFVLWNFNEFNDNTANKQLATIGVPPSSQEAIVVREVLKCLMGIKGSVISPHYDENNILLGFHVSSEISETFRDFIQEITPLASSYASIQSFVQYAMLPKRGQVLHSLADALKTILHDYYGSITQLDTMHAHRKLGLHKIIFLLRPITIVMEKICEITSKIKTNDIAGKLIFIYFDSDSKIVHL